MNNEIVFKEWVKDHADLMYGYTIKRVGDDHLAKDIVQEAFLSAWRNIENYKGEVSARNWLFIILKSRIIDHFRKQAKDRMVDSNAGYDSFEAVFFDPDGHWKKEMYPASMRLDWSQPGEVREFYKIFTGCSKKLKELQHAAFTMKYVDGLESDEICQTLNISSSNFWVLIHRAKWQLRICLEKNWLV